ncbi:MAG: hypothetical protein STSR0001_18830 [Methanothrix sp.]
MKKVWTAAWLSPAATGALVAISLLEGIYSAQNSISSSSIRQAVSSLRYMNQPMNAQLDISK